MKIVVAAGGRFHSLHLAQQLMRRQLLERLYSWACTSKDTKDLRATKITSSPLMPYVLDTYFKLRIDRIFPLQKLYLLYDNIFDWWLTNHLKKEANFDLLVGWSNYVLQSIPVARARGAKIAIEAGSMHMLAQQELLTNEYQKHGFSAPPIDQRNIEKVLQEYDLADAIMVPSEHVRQSFVARGVPAEKLYKVPYGTDVSLFKPRTIKPPKFSILCVGRIGFAKGIHYLLTAWRMLNLDLKHAQLDIVGPVDSVTQEYLKSQQIPSSVVFHGGVPQHELPNFYSNASLFVLPSLQEGLAMVLVEAMASGLPILATTHTGADDIIRPNIDGWTVPIADAEKLAERIAWAYQNQDAAFEMGQQAAHQAHQYTWDRYGDGVVAAYKKICQE